eukprot:scpid64722/ scgid23758/ 
MLAFRCGGIRLGPVLRVTRSSHSIGRQQTATPSSQLVSTQQVCAARRVHSSSLLRSESGAAHTYTEADSISIYGDGGKATISALLPRALQNKGELEQQAMSIMRNLNYSSPEALLDGVNAYIGKEVGRHSADGMAMRVVLWELVLKSVVDLQDISGRFDWQFLQRISLDNRMAVQEVAWCSVVYAKYCTQMLAAMAQVGASARATCLVCTVHVLSAVKVAPPPSLVDAFWAARNVFLAHTPAMTSFRVIAGLLSFLGETANSHHDFRPLARVYLEQAARSYPTVDLSVANNCIQFCRLLAACRVLGVESTQLTQAILGSMVKGRFGAKLFIMQAIDVGLYFVAVNAHMHPAVQGFFNVYITSNPFFPMNLQKTITFCWLMHCARLPIPERQLAALVAELEPIVRDYKLNHPAVLKRSLELCQLVRGGVVTAPAGSWQAELEAWLPPAMRVVTESFRFRTDLEDRLPFAQMSVETPHGWLLLAGFMHRELNVMLPWPRGCSPNTESAAAAATLSREELDRLPGVPVGLVLIPGAFCMRGDGHVSPIMQPLKAYLEERGWGLAIVPLDTYRRDAVVDVCLLAMGKAKDSVERADVEHSGPSPTADTGAVAADTDT